jgi:NAD(P)-dependent dehydrogenase (short-subunit alcohol dehydrogenase family)
MNGYCNFDLTSNVALVTGPAHGLGRAISLALIHAGADVVLGLLDVNSAGYYSRLLRRR